MAIKNVAAVVSGMDEEYPYQIILGINKFAKENNINISYFSAFGGIIDSKDFDAGEFSVYTLPDFSRFDGAILLSNTFSNAQIRDAIHDKVKAAGIPAVIFECKDYDEFYDISINNYSVMKKLVEHLIFEHNVRDFGFISGPDTNPEACERYKAFRDALSENGIEFDDRRFFQGYFRSYDGIKAIEDFEKSGMPLPEAFVCANDSMALTAMSKLQHLGYKIPEDVIITGFDNISYARSACPVMTTVKRPLFYSGQKACQVLLNLMNGVEQPKSTYIEAEPVFAESCGCAYDDVANIRAFRQETYYRMEMTNTNVRMLNRLIAGLAGSQNIEECLDSIEQMIDMLECKDFSLCLVSDWENSFEVADFGEDGTPYPPMMTAPLVMKDGDRRSVKSFPSSQLFPEPLTTGGNISYFLPLHFSKRCLGYYIMTNNDFPIYSILCHTMTMCIGNAIDNISKLNVLDPLCKIYNRNGFNKNADYVLKECIASQSPMTICFIDLDHLKQINDNYGHKEGDFAIKGIADAIRMSCTSVDVCGRFGGDEFIVLGRGEEFSEKFENNLKECIDELNADSGKLYKISASIGHVTVVPNNNDSLFDLIQKADEKMYLNKNLKR